MTLKRAILVAGLISLAKWQPLKDSKHPIKLFKLSIWKTSSRQMNIPSICCLYCDFSPTVFKSAGNAVHKSPVNSWDMMGYTHRGQKNTQMKVVPDSFLSLHIVGCICWNLQHVLLTGKLPLKWWQSNFTPSWEIRSAFWEDAMTRYDSVRHYFQWTHFHFIFWQVLTSNMHPRRSGERKKQRNREIEAAELTSNAQKALITHWVISVVAADPTDNQKVSQAKK